MFGDRVRMRRAYKSLSLADGSIRDHETRRECTLNELLAQCNDWTRQSPHRYVYWVPFRTQPEIGDLNTRD